MTRLRLDLSTLALCRFPMGGIVITTPSISSTRSSEPSIPASAMAKYSSMVKRRGWGRTPASRAGLGFSTEPSLRNHSSASHAGTIIVRAGYRPRTEAMSGKQAGEMVSPGRKVRIWVYLPPAGSVCASTDCPRAGRLSKPPECRPGHTGAAFRSGHSPTELSATSTSRRHILGSRRS